MESPRCEATHGEFGFQRLQCTSNQIRSQTISDDPAFDECVILSKDAFDPDAVFMDDIVDDDVLPYLSLAVDGLTRPGPDQSGRLELRPEAAAANEAIEPDSELPNAPLDPEQLEVYGWESSLWRKLKSYIGF